MLYQTKELEMESSDLWWKEPPKIERYGNVQVVREDLIAGGSKMRFLPFLVGGAKELVFGAPFCGGAPYALSVWGQRMKVKVTLFYAKRKHFHARQVAALRNGATIRQVKMGYMINVQAKARAYAKEAGAMFLPLGFDLPLAQEPYVAHMKKVAAQASKVDQVWCAVGSGMLARCLANAFPNAEIHGVIVGLASKNSKQEFPPNVILHSNPLGFEEQNDYPCPFPACKNYERKAWQQCESESKGSVMFWNVLA